MQIMNTAGWKQGLYPWAPTLDCLRMYSWNRKDAYPCISISFLCWLAGKESREQTCDICNTFSSTTLKTCLKQSQHFFRNCISCTRRKTILKADEKPTAISTHIHSGTAVGGVGSTARHFHF